MIPEIIDGSSVIPGRSPFCWSSGRRERGCLQEESYGSGSINCSFGNRGQRCHDCRIADLVVFGDGSSRIRPVESGDSSVSLSRSSWRRPSLNTRRSVRTSIGFVSLLHRQVFTVTSLLTMWPTPFLHTRIGMGYKPTSWIIWTYHCWGRCRGVSVAEASSTNHLPFPSACSWTWWEILCLLRSWQKVARRAEHRGKRWSRWQHNSLVYMSITIIKNILLLLLFYY